MAHLGMKSPIYITGNVEPKFGPDRYIHFEGFSVDENGKQHYMDATVAYRQTCLRVIEYLKRYGSFSTYNIEACILLTYIGKDTTITKSTCCFLVHRSKVCWCQQVISTSLLRFF